MFILPIIFPITRVLSAQMRAQNQQDLIYKRGQAGITKASVTIVFDNSERSKSPVGLENYKQITVTRQVLVFSPQCQDNSHFLLQIALPNVSKYLLNGHKSQQQTIQTLFQSVQLNINNPNFVIMQGRITKVCCYHLLGQYGSRCTPKLCFIVIFKGCPSLFDLTSNMGWIPLQCYEGHQREVEWTSNVGGLQN